MANKKATCQGPEPQCSGGLTFQEKEGENEKGWEGEGDEEAEKQEEEEEKVVFLENGKQDSGRAWCELRKDQ